MQGQESLTEKRTRLARKLLENAEQEIAAGDLVQGSEKLWGTTSQALKAYCASHGLPHGRYAQRRQAVFDLATRQNARLSGWPFSQPKPATPISTTTGWSRKTWTATCPTSNISSRQS